MSNSILIQKTLEFSEAIMPIVKALKDSNNRVLADQLFRSGTSIGANIHEAQAAESKKDFLHKFRIASKEAWETLYWLKLSQLYINIPPDIEFKRSIIHKMINKSITTTKRNLELETENKNNQKTL